MTEQAMTDYTKKKLIKMLAIVPEFLRNLDTSLFRLFRLVDYLIANGVTVGKPFTEFLHPVDAYPGLKAKFLVFKADTGERVADCFVLRPAKDPAAVEALRAYANATDNETLAEDIYNWAGKGTPAQQWIPVTERLPEMKTDVLMYFRDDKNAKAGFLCDVDEDRSMWCAYTDGGFYTDCDYEPTHWMPLPNPPKEETQ